MTRRMIYLEGPPGCGKSTIRTALEGHAEGVEVDGFFSVFRNKSLEHECRKLCFNPETEATARCLAMWTWTLAAAASWAETRGNPIVLERSPFTAYAIASGIASPELNTALLAESLGRSSNWSLALLSAKADSLANRVRSRPARRAWHPSGESLARQATHREAYERIDGLYPGRVTKIDTDVPVDEVVKLVTRMAQSK